MALSSVLTPFRPTSNAGTANPGAVSTNVATPTAATVPTGAGLQGTSGALQSGSINSLLTSEGVNPNGENLDAHLLQNASGALSPLLGEQLTYGSSLEPQRESAINDYINSMGQSGVNANIASFGNAAQENAGVSARNADLALQGQGAGEGAIAGNTGNLFNNAALSTNNYGAQENSPQMQQQRLAGTLSAIMQGMNSPALQTEEGLFGPLNTQGQFNQQVKEYNSANSPLGQIGGLIGSGLADYATGGLSGIIPSLSGGGGDSWDDISSYAPGGENFSAPSTFGAFSGG